ncbi:MAG: mandelate racemase/muconate lactonizing enzyme family protein [Hasllibacter sp.]
MNLADLDILTVAPPAPGWGGRWWTLVKLTAEDGTTGWGECYATAIGPAALRAVIEDVFERHLKGRSAFDLELAFRRVHSSGFTQRPDPTVTGAFAGLEIACWDLIGKALGQPVWRLLGGRTNPRVRGYTYLYPEGGDDPAFWTDPEANAAAAARAVADGWTAVKLDPAGAYGIRGGRQPGPEELTRAGAMVMAVREAIGDRADLLVGTHGQFTPSGAIRFAQAVAPARPLWFEEPIPPDDPAGMATVAAGQPIPLSAGERLTTAQEFAPLLAARSLAVAQPALGRVGGIGEGRRVAHLAAAFGAQIAPHLYAGPVEWAANLHLCTAMPNVLMAECIDSPFHRALIGGALRVERGHAAPTDAPGLGIEVDEALARAHPHEGDRLHLEMRDAPVDPLHGGTSKG